MVKIITASNSSKSPGLNCAVVLKSFEFEHPDIIADIFKMYLRESRIPCETVGKKCYLEIW